MRRLTRIALSASALLAAAATGGLIGFAWHAPGRPGTWDDVRNLATFGVVTGGFSAWPALALAGSFELLMTLVRTGSRAISEVAPAIQVNHPLTVTDGDAPPALTKAPSLEQAVRTWHIAGRSQRAIARHLNIDRRKIRRILDQAL